MAGVFGLLFFLIGISGAILGFIIGASAVSLVGVLIALFSLPMSLLLDEDS